MNIVIVGLGSMGRRRLRLLRQHAPQHALYGVDIKKERRELLEQEFNLQTFENIHEALESCDLDSAIICSSPIAHADQITNCLKAGLHVFTELNVVADGYERNIQLANHEGKVLFQSATLLYRQEIETIRNMVSQTARCLYTYHVGQYLPDWHPWENYQDYFVAEVRTNACREIFCVQLPWLIDVFGEVEDINVQCTSISSLPLKYDDTYVINLLHKTGHIGSLVVDVVAREPICSLRVSSEDLLLSWQGNPNSLRRYDIETMQWKDIATYASYSTQQNYQATIIEDAYWAELECFFQEISGKPCTRYTMQEDAVTLELIDRIEGALS